MSPYQFAKSDCANHLGRGNCLGVLPWSLSDNAGPAKAQPRGSCLLAERPIKPCEYFDVCVLPLADKLSPTNQPGLQERRLAARAAYLSACMGEKLGVKARACPDCGGLLGKRTRFCERCAKKRRRESARNGMRRNRKRG